ncbi:MAG TPA: oxygenase MpaB family protein, partial [Acidimicrobiales bacterium]|nr:oxygenase MpaB family protein [Acidimicrobiales bacterium]
MAVPGPKSVVRSAATATMSRVFPRGRPAITAVPAGDAGIFGPESVTWRVHSNFSMFAGGIRALVVQTLHPLAMAGVAEHSNYRADPLGRLHRTAAFIAATTYGTTADADAAIARVRAIHERVRGVAPDGRPYAANDPELLAWVHHVEVQSFLLAYQRLGPGLSAADADRYVREMARLGERMGVVAPMTTADALHAWVRDHPEQRATAEARAAVRFLILAPLPLAARAPYAVLLAAAISLVPLRQRLALGLVLPGPVLGRLASEPVA